MMRSKLGRPRQWRRADAKRTCYFDRDVAGVGVARLDGEDGRLADGSQPEALAADGHVGDVEVSAGRQSSVHSIGFIVDGGAQ